MDKKVPFFNWKRSKTVLEILAGLAFLFMLVIGAFFWRVSKSPLDMAFAKPYIEEALTNHKRGVYTELGKIVLHWPDLAGPLLLDVEGAKVFGPDKNLIVGVDEMSLTLSKAGLLIGRILPVGLVVKNPELTIIHEEDGTYDIGFGDVKRQEDVENQTALTTRILEHVARPGNETDSPLATLKNFEIHNAQVNVYDRQTDLSTYLPLVDVEFNSTPEGLDSDLFVTFDDSAEWPSHLRASFVIPWEKKDVVIDANLENFDMTFLADKIPALAVLDGQDIEVDGRLYGVLDENFRPVQLQMLANSPTGSFMIPEFSADRVPYENFAFELLYDESIDETGIGQLALGNTQVTVKDVTINAEGSFHVSPTNIAGPLKFSIKELKQSQIKPLWPKVLEGDNAEEWVVERMSQGTFTDVWAALDLSVVKGEEGWNFNVNDAHAAFSFENMSVDYRAPLTAATKAHGRGIFKLKEEKLSIKFDEAMIGDIKVSEGDLEMVNIIEHGKAKADIRLKLDGPLKTGLEYLSKEPIHLKHSFDLTKVKGNAKTTVNITFPAHGDLKVKDVKVNGEGVMSDVTLPGIAKVLELTGGPLNFAVKNNQFTLNGDAKISGQPAKIDYSEFLESEGQAYRSKIKASLPVTDEMRALLGIDLTEFLSGPVNVDLVYTEYSGGKADADLNVALTEARVFYDPFGYNKEPGQVGTATFKAGLQDGLLKSVSDLKVTAPALQIQSANIAFMERAGKTELASGNLPNMAINDTVANLDFKVSDAGKFDINLTGSFLDLRPFLETDEHPQAYDSPPMRVNVKVDRMRASEWEPIQAATLVVDIDGTGSFNELELTGVAGKDLFIRYKPDETGKRVFRMEANDAGAALRAFGVYENIRGGRLVVAGDPIKGYNDRNVKGLGQITDFKVVNAPVLAQLLGIMSLPGLLGALNNDGLNFTKLEANFDWLYRREGSILVVKDGRTSGNSVGFTFDGSYDKVKNLIDVEGTMIPLSGINKVIGSIPLVGDILTGGSGSLIAATYSVKGDAKKPTVFVNPLSVLTPGILRRILFEN